MAIKPETPLQVGDWQYLPEQDKLVQFADNGSIAVTADLDNLSQKVVNYFIVHAGKLVTKDELLQDVWGIRDVSDGRVTRVIRVLRVALGDDTREPRYIETIPKRGYRFIAPVTELVLETAIAEPSADYAVDNVDEAPKSKIKPLWLAAAAILLLIPVLLFWNMNNKQDEKAADIPILRYKPVTAMDGLEFYQNVSADERYIVFSYASPGTESITVLTLQDMQEHRKVTITEPGYSSFGAAFNPDGTQVAYHRMYPDGACEIRVITLDLAQLQPQSDELLTVCGANSISSRISWSPDGNYLLYPTMSSSKQMVIMLKPVHGGAAEQLTVPPPSSFGDYVARFSNSGTKVLFLRDAAGAAQLWTLDLSNREIRMLVNITDTLPGNVDWDNTDQFIIYPSAPTALSKVDVRTGKTQVIAYTDYAASEIQMGKSGVLYASVGNFSHINIRKVPNKLKAMSASIETVFSSNRNETMAEVSPIENDPIAVVSRRSGLPQVWLFYPDGNQKQITYFANSERFRSLVFAPDGKSLVAQVNNEVWLLSASQEPRQIASGQDNLIANPVWSADGKSVYYAESKNGRWNIIKLDQLEQEPVASIVAENRELYIESYDHKYAIWRDANSKTFYIEHYDSGKIETLPISLPENQFWLKFQLKADGIYFTYLLEDIHYKLQFYDFNTQLLSDVIDSDLYHSRFSLSPDERFVYILQSVRGDFDIAEIELP